MSLEFALQELQGNISVLLEAVIKNGLALTFASLSLRSDCNVVALAVLSHDRAVQFACVPLQAFALSMKEIQCARPW